MEKIIVNPLEGRGLGNIVSPKTIEDFEVYNSSLSFEDNVYTLEYSPGTVSVALTVSSGSITIGESIVLEAIVTDDGVPLENVSVRFVTGNQVLGTDDTDVNGEASLTVSDLSVGSYSIYASAKGKSSSPVSVTVSKLTPSITLSVPASGTVGTSYSITGTLVPTSGSVKLYENSVLKDTLTVSSGSFSKAITQSNEGTYSYYAVFEGSSTYSSVTSSTGSIVVSDVPPVPVVTSVSLTGDKSILSYADSQSATLSATVLDDNDDPMEGVTVTFYNGSTSMGTADTNSSGVATKSYASTGAGDLSFTAVVGTISSETYSLEDCVRVISEATFTRDTTAWISFSEMSDWIVECDFKSTSTRNQRFIVHTGTNAKYNELGCGYSYGNRALNVYIGSPTGTETGYGNTVPAVANQYYHFTIEKHSDNTAIVSIDDVEYFNGSISTISENERKITIYVADSATNTVKNLKIKPL